MGSSDKQIADALKMCPNCNFSSEQPQHLVNLNAYQIGKYEITNQQYNQCLRAGVCTGNAVTTKLDHPVVRVNWYAAETFCKWVGGRLPTEAEWEKAARGGLEGKIYPWGDEAPTCTTGAPNGANFGGGEGCPGALMPVGSYTPNGYGLYDMAGNVWEWLNDWYDSGYYANSPLLNPLGPDSGISRVLRGDSWYNTVNYIRSALRYKSVPTIAYNYVGFRCARDVP
jgi:formylglycine-generating enzyme required for sulfatase activity